MRPVFVFYRGSFVLAIFSIIFFTYYLREDIRNAIDQVTGSHRRMFNGLGMLIGKGAYPDLTMLDLEKSIELSHTGIHPWYRPMNITIVPSNICTPSQKVLFVVLTAIEHFEKRDTIRETFGHKKYFDKYNVRTLFPVGKTYSDIDAKQLETEARYHGDILQGDFHDGYRNLTIKDLLWMRFIRDSCPQIELVVVLCDDMLPNIFMIMDDFNAGRISHNHTYTCLAMNGPILRDPILPWSVPAYVLPDANWGMYCSGTAYIMSANTIPMVVNATEHFKHYVSVDDAFLSGTMARPTGAQYNFTFYGGKYTLADAQTEEGMLTKKYAFGLVVSMNAAKRMYHNLEHIYGMKSDDDTDMPTGA